MDEGGFLSEDYLYTYENLNFEHQKRLKWIEEDFIKNFKNYKLTPINSVKNKKNEIVCYFFKQ